MSDPTKFSTAISEILLLQIQRTSIEKINSFGGMLIASEDGWIANNPFDSILLGLWDIYLNARHSTPREEARKKINEFILQYKHLSNKTIADILIEENGEEMLCSMITDFIKHYGSKGLDNPDYNKLQKIQKELNS